MTLHSLTKPTPHALQAYHDAMLMALEGIKAPRLYADTEPSEFENVRDYIAQVRDVMDTWIERVGREAQCHTTLPLTGFDKPFRATLEGNAEFELTRAAETLREEFA